MRRMLLASSAAVLMAAPSLVMAQTAPYPKTPQPAVTPAPGPAPVMIGPSQVYGGVQDLHMVDGIPGATYGNGAIVSPSGDSQTYVNTTSGG